MKIICVSIPKWLKPIARLFKKKENKVAWRTKEKPVL